MNQHPLNVMIIGCGLIGKKRALAVLKNGDRIVALVDKNLANALSIKHTLPKQDPSIFCGVDYYGLLKDWKETIDVVIVATPHNVLSQIVSDALGFGKYVLVEKPAGRSYKDVDFLLALHKGEFVRVGYNMRFHPATILAKDFIASSCIFNCS